MKRSKRWKTQRSCFLNFLVTVYISDKEFSACNVWNPSFGINEELVCVDLCYTSKKGLRCCRQSALLFNRTPHILHIELSESQNNIVLPVVAHPLKHHLNPLLGTFFWIFPANKVMSSSYNNYLTFPACTACPPRALCRFPDCVSTVAFLRRPSSPTENAYLPV